MLFRSDNKPLPRKITVGTSLGSDWVVLGGLQAGERVIVDGFQKLAMGPPGGPVNPVPWTAPGKGGPAGANGPAGAGPAGAGPAAAGPGPAGASAASTAPAASGAPAGASAASR